MKNLAKLIVISVFGIAALAIFLSSFDLSKIGSVVFAEVNFMPTAKPTPPANVKANTAATNAAVNMNAAPAATSAANAANANTVKPAATGDSSKTIPKKFTLGVDSQSEYAEVPFDHDTHAFGKYSPDGKSVMGCVECHHTDQPKSALTPPLLTSERDITMTIESWRASSQKVSNCRACHFQDGGEIPDGKTMPKATYTDGGKSKTKTLDNQLAYHINCNTCHDAAFKLRPELKKAPGFATSSDCAVCHKTN